jgi:hypothetical protein
MTHFIPGRAVLIAVSAYSKVSPLPQAVLNDASDIASTLINPRHCGYDPAKVQLITERDATRDNILRAIDDSVEKLTTEEPFFFFFSGHGDRHGEISSERSYLLGQNASFDDYDVTAVSDADLVERLNNLLSHRQVVILDACHAGGIGTLKATRHDDLPKGIGAAAPQNLSSGRGRVIMTSCRSDEVSVVLSGARNSVFTTSILHGLQGRAKSKSDGTIGIFDLFEYVSRDVTSRSGQHPLFKADSLEGNFSIARGAITGEKSPSIQFGPSAVGEVVKVLSELYPLGPTQAEIWSRAGGDLSRIAVGGQGRAQWFAAVQMLRQGGGGTTASKLLETVLDDFPRNETVMNLLQRS